MNTVKSYTDLEQSRKLAEILPLESADMHYDSGDECEICFGRGMYEEIANWICEGTPRPADIPCWSLAALFSVLPHIQEFYPTLEKINDKYVCRYKGSGIWTNGNDPIDACYEMILKLHKKKLL